MIYLVELYNKIEVHTNTVGNGRSVLKYSFRVTVTISPRYFTKFNKQSFLKG